MLQLSRKNCWCLGIILFAVIFSSVVSAAKINEVMPNPADNCNDCTEWIELYTNSPINMTNWIINATNQKTNFSFYITDFLIITKNKTAFLSYWNFNESNVIGWPGMSLSNSGEGIFLLDNNSSLIDSVIFPSFSNYENKTYSLLSNLSWTICDIPSPGLTNLCEQNYVNNTNQTNNSTNNNQTNSTQNIVQEEINLDLSHDNETTNGQEFYVQVKAYNLKNESYDIKVFVTFKENDTIISETFDKNDSSWSWSNYYLDNVLNGVGNKSKVFTLRISEKYKDFSGNARVQVKIRKNGDVDAITSYEDKITIIKRQEIETADNLITGEEIKNITTNNEIIALNKPKDIKSQDVWKSKTQYIKEYSIYGFAVFCVILIILLIIKKRF